MSTTKSLIIIGAGPGGIAAALEAESLGLDVTLVEKDLVGGTCLHRGCIPTKALIHQAHSFREAQRLSTLGIELDKKNYCHENLEKSIDNIIITLHDDLQKSITKKKIRLVKGHARIQAAGHVVLDGKKDLYADTILLATGSRPRVLKDFAFNGYNILSSDEMFHLKELPRHLAILGAGAIGLELAYAFAALGVEVTLLEGQDSLLPHLDRAVVKVLEEEWLKLPIRFSFGIQIEQIVEKEGDLEIHWKTDHASHNLRCQKLCVAIGRTPNIDDIGLENLNIEKDQGLIVTRDDYSSSMPGIYALGDIIAHSIPLAHVAEAQGRLIARHLAGKTSPQRLLRHQIPFVYYMHPEIAGFGLSEQEALQREYPIQTIRHPFRAAGKALTDQNSQGFIQVVISQSPLDKGKILGAHIVGEDAGELIHLLLLASASQWRLEDLETLIYAHPSRSELILGLAKKLQVYYAKENITIKRIHHV